MAGYTCKEYEEAFNNKVDALKDHKRYSWLRNYADECLNWHTGFGYNQVKAADSINRIIAFPEKSLREWLDGKNKLEWKDFRYFGVLHLENGKTIELPPQKTTTSLKKVASRIANNYFEVHQKLEVVCLVDFELSRFTLGRINKKAPNNTIVFGSWA